MFPHSYHAPAFIPQVLAYLPVSSTVSAYFFVPIFKIRTRAPIAPRTPMPKTPVDKHRYMIAGENKIWPSCNARVSSPSMDFIFSEKCGQSKLVYGSISTKQSVGLEYASKLMLSESWIELPLSSSNVATILLDHACASSALSHGTSNSAVMVFTIRNFFITCVMVKLKHANSPEQLGFLGVKTLSPI
jgi:hypothetical protein